MTHTIFVYGTLKQNFSNHHYLHTSQYLGTGTTVEKYAMYVAGIPYVFKHNQISVIRGEVYSVDDNTLAQLDRLEGHPGWYRREEVEILTDDDKELTAWLYFYPEPTGNLVPSGVYDLR